MLSFLSTIVVSLLLISVNAADDGGLSPTTECLLNCSTTAAKASGCGLNATCSCTSQVYVTNVTQCAGSTCSISADTIQGFLKSNCPSGVVPAAPTETGKNSAEFNVARTGAAAASAAGLMLFAFLV
ncbi:hypothetical protein FB451DRAFT_775451 [Mycena latifolia]|nr:hypothetical protein FB451DRAFT_775451 [Mycena latifolia]